MTTTIPIYLYYYVCVYIYICVHICVCAYIYIHMYTYKYIYIYVNWDFLTVPCMIWMLLGFSNATTMVHSDMASAVSSRGHSAVVLSQWVTGCTCWWTHWIEMDSTLCTSRLVVWSTVHSQYIYIYVCMYMYVYIYTYICIYVCIYI